MAHYHTVHLGKEFDDARVEMDEIGDKTGPSWSNPLQGERASILEVEKTASGDSRIVGSEDTTSTLSPEVEHLETLPPRPVIWGRGIPHVYPMVQGDPWETLKVGVDKFDKGMCDAWNGELDTILTFTGLFSAAVTAFCVESFQTLSPNPADITNILLVALSRQLANSSSPVADLSIVEDVMPTTYNVQINVLYFSSLTLALSVSSVCILGKQWIREYQKDLSVSACDAVRVRQVRFDSLEAWKVPQIMAALPVILLAALLLFFTGLLLQLWNASEHTTAVVISIVVALTALMVAVTTVVPAVCSMRPRHAAFTPFRSPQSWIFFVIYRRVQQWYQNIFRVYKQAPRTVANWSAFDLQFLQIEGQPWFEHEISSIHRALQWIYDVLRNSNVTEKNLYWCLQQQYHPENLVPFEAHLSRYVLPASEGGVFSENVNRVLYNCSERIDKLKDIKSPIGRYQAELLVRSMHYALDHVMDDSERSWAEIYHSCSRLWECGIFADYAGQDIVHHQHILQDQIALLLESVFSTLPPPSHSYFWGYIIRLLFLARDYSSSPVARHVLDDVVAEKMPDWIRKHKSIPLLQGIGGPTCYLTSSSWRHRIELFTHLDRIMVEMCAEPEAVLGLSEKSVKTWIKLRLSFTEKTRDPECGVPEQFQLPAGYFDHLPGHGVLRLILSSPLPPQRPRPSHQN